MSPSVWLQRDGSAWPSEERIEDVRRQVEEAVRLTAASADPWLTQHPPIVEWVGGVWQGTETPAPVLSLETLKRAVGEAAASRRGATYGSYFRLFTNPWHPRVLFGSR